MIYRKKTRQVKVGGITVGGDAPVRVQSMCSTNTGDVEATVEQILKLEEAGCEIIRVAVPDGPPPRRSPPSRAGSTSLWSRTSTSTTSWRCGRSRAGWTRCG